MGARYFGLVKVGLGGGGLVVGGFLAAQCAQMIWHGQYRDGNVGYCATLHQLRQRWGGD